MNIEFYYDKDFKYVKVNDEVYRIKPHSDELIEALTSQLRDKFSKTKLCSDDELTGALTNYFKNKFSNEKIGTK